MPGLFNGHVCVETFIAQVEHISGYLADTRPYKRSVELFYSIANPIFISFSSLRPFIPPLVHHVHPFSPLARTANEPLLPSISLCSPVLPM